MRTQDSLGGGHAGSKMIEIKHKETGKVLLRVDADTLVGVELDGAYMEGANLAGMDLAGADLEDSDLTAANLRGTNLCEANLRRTWFAAADLSQAKLAGTRYTPATRWPDSKVPDRSHMSEPGLALRQYRSTRDGGFRRYSPSFQRRA